VPIQSGDDRRRFVPLVLVQVLTTLIDELDDGPDYRRAELRNLRTRLCRLYKLDDPMAQANESSVAQMMEEADGLPIEE